MARLCSGMASSDETIMLRDETITSPIEDILNHDYCFSDGVGRISRACLTRVLQSLHPNDRYIQQKTSAIQVRVAGYKGVLVLDISLPDDDGLCYLRKSMRKFESLHRKLEVLNTLTSFPVHLNRQSIQLLSALGVQNSVFEGLQEQQLKNLLTRCTLDQEQEIIRCCKTLPLKSVLGAGIRIPVEPFLQSLLQAVYNQMIQDLVEKTRIFVPEGRLLMGVMDETLTLSYGEIYVQLCDDSTNWTKKIIKGPCVAYKNPCFHPGDVRILQAKDDVPEILSNLVNCVVFPGKGNRPHVNEMSGSDLDGDLYSVIWMPHLIPPMQYNPMEYDTGIEKHVPQVQESDMVDFFIEAIGNRDLGVIANSHLALADSRETGPLSEECIELARLHAEAVDFPKTGCRVQIPKTLLPCKYPDFMEKTLMNCYKSTKIIGRLYRRAKSLLGTVGRNAHACTMEPDKRFLISGHDQHCREAKQLYGEYCNLVHGLMKRYGIETEAELVTGHVRKMYDHLNSEKLHWVLIVNLQYTHIVKSFRELFEKSAFSAVKERRYQLASAWYWAAYTDLDNNRCLSFPWIVSDLLTVIYFRNRARDQTSSSICSTNSGQQLLQDIYESMVFDFKERLESVHASVLERQDLCETVQICVQGVLKNATVKMFGSSSYLLFEPALSDVDLCIQLSPVTEHGSQVCSTGQIRILESVLPSLLEDYPGTHLIKDTPVPILKYETSTTKFDLTADVMGFRKSRRLLKYMMSFPGLVLILTVVVRWARHAGLVAQMSKGLFTSFGISWLVIQFCLEQDFIRSDDLPELPSNTRQSNLLEILLDEVMDQASTPNKMFLGGVSPGKVLVSFFETFSNLAIQRLPGSTTIAFHIPDPADPTYSCVRLESNSLLMFQNSCLQALHSLMQTCNIGSLLSLGKRTVCLRLSKFQSSLFRGLEEFHAQRLSLLGGGKAEVHIVLESRGRRLQNGAGRLPKLIRISGESQAVQLIERDLKESQDVQWKLPAAGHFLFVKGAPILLFEGSLNDQDMLGFIPYTGQYHLKHKWNTLHVPVLVGEVGGSDWASHALLKLRSSVLLQRRTILRFGKDSAGDAKAWSRHFRALVRIGTLYMTNVPRARLGEALGSASISELEAWVVASKRHIEPWKELNTVEEVSSFSSGRAVQEACHSLEHCKDANWLHKCSTMPMKAKKTVVRQRHGASQSLYPYVMTSSNDLERMLKQDGFTPEKSPVKYKVSIFIPKEYTFSLDENLKFICVSKRRIRWLAASLLLKRDRRGHTEANPSEELPNCLRFCVESRYEEEVRGDMLTRAMGNPILVQVGQDEIGVGSAFKEVYFVRKTSSLAWINQTLGLTVAFLDITEWEGLDKGTRMFMRKVCKKEVELQMHDAYSCLSDTATASEAFVQKFWDFALKYGLAAVGE